MEGNHVVSTVARRGSSAITTDYFAGPGKIVVRVGERGGMGKGGGRRGGSGSSDVHQILTSSFNHLPTGLASVAAGPN